MVRGSGLANTQTKGAGGMASTTRRAKPDSAGAPRIMARAGLWRSAWRRWAARGRRFAGASLDLLIPPRCVACGTDLEVADSNAAFCAGCRRQIERERGRRCGRCGGPHFRDGEGPCAACRQQPPAFDRVWALGSYEGLLRDLVLRMKTDSSENIAAGLAGLWWEKHAAAVRHSGVDLIACVPSHPWRRWQRGADGPRALAESLASRSGTRGAWGLLRKSRNDIQQKGLSRAGRLANVRGSVVAAAGYPIESAHVLVVDDVLTTGATCHEASRVLKRAGAAAVTVAVMARSTGEPYSPRQDSKSVHGSP